MHMKNTSKVSLLLIFFASFFTTLNAQDETNTPKYSNEFLQIGVGARAYAMGNATVANVNDATAAYWNPAGLTKVQDWANVSLMHSEYFAGIAKYDYGTIAHSIDEKSTAALSFIRFGVDNIPNTTQLIDNEGRIDYDRITTFTAADMAFLFSYARELGVDGLSLGGSFKVVHRKAGDFARSWGFGLDAGLQYEINDKFSLGVMARDITSTFNAWSFNLDEATKEVFLETGNEIPENGLEITLPRIILAGSYKQDLGKNGIFLLTEMNIDVTTDRKRNVLLRSNPFSFDPHIGLEVGFKNFVAVRAGVNKVQRVKDFSDEYAYTLQPNVGIGVGFKGISLDYAFTNLGGAVNAFTHIISLKMELDKPKNMK